MTRPPLSPEDQALVDRIQSAWTPDPTDPAAFQRQLQARLARPPRRRWGPLLVPAAAAVAAAGLLHLCPAEPPVAEAPLVAQVAPAAAEPSAWWGSALEPRGLTRAMPGEYQALSTLFLQPTE